MQSIHTTRTGITIGCAWQQERPKVDADAVVIQAALLGERDPLWLRALSKFEANVGYWMVAVCAVVAVGGWLVRVFG